MVVTGVMDGGGNESERGDSGRQWKRDGGRLGGGGKRERIDEWEVLAVTVFNTIQYRGDKATEFQG